MNTNNAMDLTWLVDACGDDPKKMAQVAILLGTAALGEALRARGDTADNAFRVTPHYRALILELDRRAKRAAAAARGRH